MDGSGVVIVGVGVDLVEIARVERLLAAKGERAVRRLFSDEEARYCEGKSRPAQHFAARLAAKEAAFKALAGEPEARGIGWREIEVVPHGDGRPALALHGLARTRADALGVTAAWVTLSHTSTTAAAFVVLERC